jgi:hypothetical protein
MALLAMLWSLNTVRKRGGLPSSIWTAKPTANESTVFTGFRWENAFGFCCANTGSIRCFTLNSKTSILQTSLYSKLSGTLFADDFLTRNDRREKKREAELKLILSSNFKGWNVSENMIAEKNLRGDPWEFGYALGVSRPLALVASAKSWVFCRENLSAGAERRELVWRRELVLETLFRLVSNPVFSVVFLEF